MSPFATAAINYARQGFHVLPLRPKTKQPKFRGWTKKATADPGQAAAWWAMSPDANVGIATGAGFVVLDVDGDEGKQSLAALPVQLPETAVSMTGGGGLHYFFRTNEPVGNRVRFAPGLDSRGDGGQVAVPPSIHPNGNDYRWQREPSQGIADAPEWLLDMLRADDKPRQGREAVSLASGEARITTAGPRLPQPQGHRKTKKELGSPDAERLIDEIAKKYPITEAGIRNSKMHRAAASLICRGCPPELARDVLESWLYHHEGIFTTSMTVAVDLIDSCVASAIKALQKGRRQPWTDRHQEVLQQSLTQQQKAILRPGTHSPRHPLFMRDDTRGIGEVLGRLTNRDRQFLEVLMLHCSYEQAAHPDRGDIIHATNDQLQSLMVHRFSLPYFDDRQLTRAKKKFISKGDSPASVVEILVRVVEGKRGSASQYRITPVGKILLGLEQPSESASPADSPATGAVRL